MKSLIIRFMAFIILANSLSWIIDGDIETVVNNHEIHEMQSEHEHLTASSTLDDHHCQISSHFAPAVLNNTFAPLGQASRQELFHSKNNYLSTILKLPKRPPIAIS
jgi:hypothetical protein